MIWTMVLVPVVDVRIKMTREEIFGPVQSILKFETMEELIERVNDTSYGLAAGILTSNLNNVLVFTQVGMETMMTPVRTVMLIQQVKSSYKWALSIASLFLSSNG